MKTIFALALAAVLLMPPIAGAADEPAPVFDDPESTIVSALIVRAATPGPAWWKVSKGDSVVWILGMPAGPTPRGMDWDQRALNKRLRGANFLLLPSAAAFSAGGGPGAPPPNGPNGWKRADVEKAMPPALAERFTRLRISLKMPVRRYATPVPLTASFKLYNDTLEAAALQRGGAKFGPWNQVLAAAGRTRVHGLRPAVITLPHLSLEDAALTRPQAAACFSAHLDAAETPAAVYRQAAEGWANGDLAAALAAPRLPMSFCESRLFQQGYSRKVIAEQVAAVETALLKPGKSVALVHLRTLLAEDGVLEILAAKGYKILDPVAMEHVD